MTWYRKIEMVQEPFDNGIDASGRAQVAFNIAVIKRSSGTFLEEIVKILVDATVGVYGTTIFDTSKAILPKGGDTAFLSIIETSGSPPEDTQNSTILPAYPQPSAQITARATDYTDARALARAAYVALAPIQNVDISP
jgi:hypothetical protein